ncbi:MAG: DUF167 domain-containing protein [Proteobacteria bacterium]|uniref:DUF167 domain-containing protein n=1 Tax=Aquabacterium sp. TaxID=1872578 RepID=UPI0035C6E4CF|nr:DUF167 domain-containing protein [Pseudomonadota bacterium]
MTSPSDAASPWPCLREERKAGASRAILDVSVSPNAKRTEIVGWHDGALRLRLAAPPVDGAANEALRKWLAQQLGLPQSHIELLRGASGRRKQWAIDTEAADVAAWLARQAALRN